MSAAAKAKISAKAKERWRDNQHMRDMMSKGLSDRMKRIHKAARESKMKIDLDDLEVIDVSMETVRSWLEDPEQIGTREEPEARGNVEIFNETLEGALDKAQGDLHMGNSKEQLIVVRVRA